MYFRQPTFENTHTSAQKADQFKWTNEESIRTGLASKGKREKKARRELCKQPWAVEKVHAPVRVSRNRRSTGPLRGHLIKTPCRGLRRYRDCNFASQ